MCFNYEFTFNLNPEVVALASKIDESYHPFFSRAQPI